jgi:hypothetical protein
MPRLLRERAGADVLFGRRHLAIHYELTFPSPFDCWRRPRGWLPTSTPLAPPRHLFRPVTGQERLWSSKARLRFYAAKRCRARVQLVRGSCSKCSPLDNRPIRGSNAH